MTTLNLYEIFDKIAAAPTKEEKQYILATNDSPAMRQIIRATFDPRIEFVFDKPVNYRPSDAPVGLSHSSIYMEMDRLYIFEKNNPNVAPNLTQARKELLLIQLLESLEAREAETLMNVILKDLKVSGLDYELANNTFPGLLT